MEPYKLAEHLRWIAEQARQTAAEAEACARDIDVDAAIDARLAEHAKHWREYVELDRLEVRAQRAPSVRRALKWALVRLLV